MRSKSTSGSKVHCVSVNSSPDRALGAVPDASNAVLHTLETAGRDSKQAPDNNGLKLGATVEMKSENDIGGHAYERSASLDTASSHGNRDQCAVDNVLSPEEGFARPSLHCSQSLVERRSGSVGGSGGGAGPGAHGHHNGWHSTEWWRSFSSSRLNEMATEEPDKRSPEMRKVPYVGGAEPMCTMVHGMQCAP